MTAVCLRKLPGARRECRTVLEVFTNGAGVVTAVCVRCERHARGCCWQCGNARENTGARALFCNRCRELRRREANSRWERHESAKEKAARRRRDRLRNQTAERKAWRAAWVAANPDRIKHYKRREALNPTARRRERERYHNSRPERIEAKRAHARARYYELHPVRPNPVCRTCGNAIAWGQRGRPPVLCDGCAPASVARKRKRPAPAKEIA